MSLRKFAQSLLLLGFLAIYCCGCNADSKTICVEPVNPYEEGGGHYAGFEWEEQNVGNCDGNSESFNEGCQEYLLELNKYNKCISEK